MKIPRNKGSKETELNKNPKETPNKSEKNPNSPWIYYEKLALLGEGGIIH